MASKAAASGGDAAASPAGGGIAGSGFTVVISGQLESGRALGYDSLSAEYFFEAGPDWTRVDGIATGVTQTAFRGGGGASREAVWGMPLDVAYRTTNAYGWPRIGVAVSAIDALGRPVIVGYGSVLVPLAGSGHTRRIRLFAPVSSTLLQRFFAWVTANPPRVSPAPRPVCSLAMRPACRVVLLRVQLPPPLLLLQLQTGTCHARPPKLPDSARPRRCCGRSTGNLTS